MSKLTSDETLISYITKKSKLFSSLNTKHTIWPVAATHITASVKRTKVSR